MTTTGSAILADAGVSLWLDDLSRSRLQDGSLEQLQTSHRVVGVTTNPSIFANAIGGSDTYDDAIEECAQRGLSVTDTITQLTTEDVQQACDLFADIFVNTGGQDGRVSIEVEPELAHDTDRTVVRARELVERVARPNVMIKIPATEAGLPAITQVIAQGVSVNVTLIFSLRRYREVLNAFYTGLELAKNNGIDLASIRSVASFFISRFDSVVDPAVEERMPDRADERRGTFSLANAAAAYEIWEQAKSTERAAWLASFGAHDQRLLWASTGVKDERLPTDWYVTNLVAKDTVNTLPEATLRSVNNLERVDRSALPRRIREAPLTLNELGALGLTYDDVTAALERDGVRKFQDSWRELEESVRQRMGGSFAS